MLEKIRRNLSDGGLSKRVANYLQQTVRKRKRRRQQQQKKQQRQIKSSHLGTNEILVIVLYVDLLLYAGNVELVKRNDSTGCIINLHISKHECTRHKYTS